MANDLALERRVIELRYGEAHLSRAKVAAELQISVGKVRGIEDRVLRDLTHFEQMAHAVAVIISTINPAMARESQNMESHVVLMAAYALGRIGAADRDVREALHVEPSWG